MTRIYTTETVGRTDIEIETRLAIGGFGGSEGVN